MKHYLRDFDFRYNTRKVSYTTRATEALKGITEKRLTYWRPTQRAASAQALHAPQVAFDLESAA